MNRYTLANDYIKLIRENEQHYFEDYVETLGRVGDSTAIYKGEPVPFLYQPMFFTQAELRVFDELSATMITILNKVIDRYVADEAFRSKFGYSELLEELVLVEPQYHINVPVARFDIFMHEDGRFKFCELNADGASGMNETNELDRIFLDSAAVKALKERMDIDYMELVERWVDCSLEIYGRCPGVLERPSVAIIDWRGGSTAIEFEQFRCAYENKGIRAVIADPRDVVYRDGQLFYEDMPIHMVYRRLVTGELIERQDEIPDFIAACREGKVCMIGAVRSQIIHNKIIFKILHDADTVEYLSVRERQFIADHIPWTVDFAQDDALFERCMGEKDSYILKPRDLYASRGVYAGQDHTAGEWETITKQCFNNGYILQEFYDPPTMPMLEMSEQGIDVRDYKYIIGLYMYGERFAGIYNRVSQSNIIASLHGSLNIANLIMK